MRGAEIIEATCPRPLKRKGTSCTWTQIPNSRLSFYTVLIWLHGHSLLSVGTVAASSVTQPHCGLILSRRTLPPRAKPLSALKVPGDYKLYLQEPGDLCQVSSHLCVTQCPFVQVMGIYVVSNKSDKVGGLLDQVSYAGDTGPGSVRERTPGYQTHTHTDSVLKKANTSYTEAACLSHLLPLPPWEAPRGHFGFPCAFSRLVD